MSGWPCSGCASSGPAPVKVNVSPWGLKGRHLAGEKCRRDFGQRLGALGSQAEAGIGRRPDIATDGFRLGNFEARKCPTGTTQRLVSFEPELDDLPAGDGLAIHEPQF